MSWPRSPCAYYLLPTHALWLLRESSCSSRVTASGLYGWFKIGIWIVFARPISSGWFVLTAMLAYRRRWRFAQQRMLECQCLLSECQVTLRFVNTSLSSQLFLRPFGGPRPARVRNAIADFLSTLAPQRAKRMTSLSGSRPR